MKDLRASRRRFVLASLVFSGLNAGGFAWSRAGAAWASSGDDAILTPFARALFPHEGLSDKVYSGVMAKVLAGFLADPDTAALLDEALAALDAQQESSWFDAEATTRTAAIENIQGEAFFIAILAAVRGAFYYDPAVWAHIDYPGSSREYGGYIDRGFDDIDWLPDGG